MLELLLSSGRIQTAADDSDVAYPAGTPFKGVVPSASFIAGDTLAAAITLTAGLPFNTDAGWLHFIEDTGLELYIAKKPLRYGLSYEDINTAYATHSEITISGEVYMVRNLTGAVDTAVNSTPANAGGEWNRYMYNIYNQSDRAGIPEALLWGNYTLPMLGLSTQPPGNDLSNGVFNICAELLPNGQCLRGNDWQSSSGGYTIKGIWNMPAINPQSYYGWRPVLVKKSTIPPTPFKGEVLGADLITGSALVAALGISTGTVVGDGNPVWLMFVDNGKTFYMPKTPLRTSVLWETLNDMGAVHGTKTIIFGGKVYKVRLMTGGTSDPATVGGGEYNAYFTRVTTFYTGAASDRWGNYSAADIGWVGGTGSGELTLCQEQYSTNGPLTRGYPGFAGLWYQAPGSTHDGYGWRPVLELVGDAP